MVLHADDFELYASDILRRDLSRCSPSLRDHRFRSLFGVSSRVCAVLWEYLRRHGSFQRKKGSSPKHLLWALLFLKLYGNEETHASLVGGVDRKTYRKWVWIVLKDIRRLKKHLVCTMNSIILSFIYILYSFIVSIF